MAPTLSDAKRLYYIAQLGISGVGLTMDDLELAFFSGPGAAGQYAQKNINNNFTTTQNVTGNVVASNALVASGVVQGGTVTATGAVNGSSAAITNAVTAAAVTASGTVQGGTVKSTGNLDINPAVSAVAPAAGVAAALPATPTGYATILIAGLARQVAYY